MKLPYLLAALCVSLPLGGQAFAQAPATKNAPTKSPADVDGEAFNKMYNDKEAKLSQERFKQVIAGGMGFLTKYPTHWRANNVIKDTGYFGDTIRDKKLAAYRAAYVTQLKFEIVNAKYKDGVSDDAKAALTALEVTAVDFETRETPSRDTINALREKIDALAELPGGARFLADREKSYVEILMRGIGPTAGETHLKKLLVSSQKDVATMARSEMNIVELKKTPYDVKFTSLDGKPVDFGAMRGKVVALVIWSGTGPGAVTLIDQVKQAHSFNKKNMEVIGICYDKEADREKVMKFIKENKITWPVHFDGQDAKNEWVSKLNVAKAPAIVLFDKKGLFVRNNQPANQLEPELKRLIELK